MAIDESILENLEDQDPETLKEIVVEAISSYKQLQSATTKWEQLKDQAINFYRTAGDDIEKLKDLTNEHPEVAEVVRKKFFDNKTIEEIENDKQQKQTSAQQEAEKTKVDEKLQHVLSELPDELRDKFKEEFDSLVWSNKVTLENLNKYVKATITSLDDSWIDVESAAKLASVSATTSSTSWKRGNANQERIKQEIKELTEKWLL